MSKKLKIILPIVVGLLLVLGIAWGVYAFITNTPKNTYLLSEKKTAKNLNSYVNDRFENEMKFQEKYNDNSFLSKFEVTADASKDFIEDLGLPKSVVDGTKLKGTVGHDPKSKKSTVSLSPTIVDEEIGKFQTSADDKNQYYQSPFFKDTYSIKNSEIIDGLAELQDVDASELKDKGYSNVNFNLNNQLGVLQTRQDDVDKITKRYTDLIADKLDDDDFKKGDKEKVKIDGETKKIKPVTLTISREKAKKITVAALKKAKNDKELLRLSNMNEKEYNKSIKDALKDAQDAQDKDFPKIESKIYQEKHQILKRDITITDSDDKKITIKGTNKIDDDLKVDYKVSGNDNTFEIKGTSKKKDDTYKDKYTLTSSIDYDRYTLDIDNKETQSDSKRKDAGTVTIDDGTDNYDIDYENNLDTDTKNNQQKQKLNVEFKIENEPINIILNADTKLKEKIDFDTKGAKDFNDLSEKDKEKLAKEINKSYKDNFKKITKKLED
ncbi:DUF6583 family protein [Staphylococcus warneri]|uniref:DUF6583 family protein n=1 Tax=Staphylococcus warneri TaxID=1292 RepID=UPI000951AEA2|nr:DUF6583 family protein [Staphylococcus warneri]MBE9429666.1 hypothetical protein [Staphylococcus epidermidis]OLS07332.1 hypothetical protein AUK68_05525 [Staphylococcus epidermidis]PTI19415.1 hypothetical protein BU082_09595 [Staphylococcus warneri]PTI26806.1 hypothetical protein BU081_02280 [Staphylococcus warneri]RIM97982.1 hypothetical protein BU093_08755 [Staphylococcus warneri]